MWTALHPLDAATGRPVAGLGAFADVFAQVDLLLLVWNSALVTGLVALGQMVTAALAGYASGVGAERTPCHQIANVVTCSKRHSTCCVPL